MEAVADDTSATQKIATAEQRLSELQAESQRERDWDRRSQLHEEMDQLRSFIGGAKFKATNKTAFNDAEDKAVLTVTSGLDVPVKPLPCIPSGEMIDRRATAAHQFGMYPGEKSAGGGGAPRTGLVDAGGKCSCPAGEVMLAKGHEHGFIAAVTAAFKDHYPLALRPQHFWLMVAQGVATHVDLNAEAVRASWVRHEGKKTLEVRAKCLALACLFACPRAVQLCGLPARSGATSS